MLKSRYFKEIHYKLYLILFSILPLILWSIIIYLFWWRDVKNRFHFGKIILAPILLPYFYVFVSTYGDIMSEKRLPIAPEWTLCGEIIIPPKNHIYAKWNWECGDEQFEYTIDHMQNIGTGMYDLGYTLLLLMIISTAISPRMLDNDILRNFSTILVILGFITFAFMWLNTVGIYSLIVYKMLSIIVSMGLASLLIVILAFQQYLMGV